MLIYLLGESAQPQPSTPRKNRGRSTYLRGARTPIRTSHQRDFRLHTMRRLHSGKMLRSVQIYLLSFGGRSGPSSGTPRPRSLSPIALSFPCVWNSGAWKLPLGLAFSPAALPPTAVSVEQLHKQRHAQNMTLLCGCT